MLAELQMGEATQLPATAIAHACLSFLLPTRGGPTCKPSVGLKRRSVYMGTAQPESCRDPGKLVFL